MSNVRFAVVPAAAAAQTRERRIGGCTWARPVWPAGCSEGLAKDARAACLGCRRGSIELHACRLPCASDGCHRGASLLSRHDAKWAAPACPAPPSNQLRRNPDLFSSAAAPSLGRCTSSPSPRLCTARRPPTKDGGSARSRVQVASLHTPPFPLLLGASRPYVTRA
jgi:hypothetical protein